MSFQTGLTLHTDHRRLLDDVLDRNPLIASPDTPLTDVIHLMSQAWSTQCHLSEDGAGSCDLSQAMDSSSAVLMIHEGTLQGIFTERDLVRLVSEEIDINEKTLSEVASEHLITLRIDEFQDLFLLMSRMRQHNIRHLPVLDEQDQFLGLVTHQRLRQLLQPTDLLKFRQLKEILNPEVVSATPGVSVRSITQLMARKQVSCVVIVEPGSDADAEAHDALDLVPLRPIGIITERDIVQFQLLEVPFDQTLAQDVMSTPLLLMQSDESMWKAHQTMQQMRVRRLVVVNPQGELAGIVTQSKVLQMLEPSEMYEFMELLQKQVHDLQTENVMLLKQKAMALEQEMESHIRDRLLAQTVLKDSELSYQALADNVPAVVYRLFPQEHNRMEFLNDRLKILTGFEEHELRQGDVCSIDPLIAPEDRPRVVNSVKAAIDHHQPFEINYRIRDKTGNIRHFWEQGQPILAIDQQVSHYDGVIFDLTALKETEHALQEERNFNAAILETAGALVVVVDPQGHIIRFNRACVQLTGFTIEELQQAPIWNSLVPAEEVEQVQAAFNQLLQGHYPNRHQNHWIAKDGAKHLINWSNTALTDSTGAISYIIAIGIDISEQRKLEEQFLRAQRLESIGTLASGIAHDLNNILTPILAISQLLPLKIQDLNDENRHLLEMMQESARRGTELVKQVLTFSRGLEGDRSILQLRHIVSEIRNIAYKTFPKAIEFSVDLPKDLWGVKGDPTQLHQVLMNLCVNARDAMPEGGTLQISAINLQFDQKAAQAYLEAKEGPYVLLTVSDTGIGIPPANLDKIFEPFFTTKAPSQGTGLGLSTVHGIIKNHGGFIKVYSELGKGTQFRIFLPAFEPEDSSQAVDSALPRGHGELILVIDDEVPICEITKTILETYNYRALTGSDGIEAIALYAQHQENIKLVLMDMAMPTLDCVTAVHTLQRINPDVKIVLTSGLASNENLAWTLGSGIKAFLSKPFSSTMLLKTLANILTPSK